MKYQLLLKDILKYTRRIQSDVDSVEALEQAIQVMHVIPKAANDMMNVGRLQGFNVSHSTSAPSLHILNKCHINSNISDFVSLSIRSKPFTPASSCKPNLIIGLLLF